MTVETFIQHLERVNEGCIDLGEICFYAGWQDKRKSALGLNNNGRDVLEVLRLGLAAREKQAAVTVESTGNATLPPAPMGHTRLVTPPCPKCGGETEPMWVDHNQRLRAVCMRCTFAQSVPALDEQDAD